MFEKGVSTSSFVFDFERLQSGKGTVLVKYSPPEGTDEFYKSGGLATIKVKYHCITFMKAYEHKSIEELRLEDREAGRCKWWNAGVSWGWEAPQAKPLGGDIDQPAETKPLFGGFDQSAEAKPLFGGLDRPAEIKPLFGGFDQPPETKPLFEGLDKPAQTKPLFGDFDKPAEAKPLFGGLDRPAEINPLFRGFDEPAEAKPLFGGLDRPAETKPPKPLFGGLDRPAEIKPLFRGFDEPAEAKPLFGGLDRPAEINPLFRGFDEPAEAKPLFGGLDRPAETKPPKPLFGGLDRPAEIKPLFRGFDEPAEAKPLFGGLDRPAETKPPKPLFGGFDKPTEAKPLFGGLDRPAEINPLFRGFDEPAEAKPLFGGLDRPAETKPPKPLFGGLDRPAEIKPLFRGFDEPAEAKPLFGGLDRPAEINPLFRGFDEPAEAKPLFGGLDRPAETKPPKPLFGGLDRPAEIKPLFRGFDEPAEAKPLFGGLDRPAETKPPKPLFGGFDKPTEAKPLFGGLDRPVDTKPLFRGFDQPAKPKPSSGKPEDGVGAGMPGDTTGEGIPRVACGTASKTPSFNLEVISNEDRMQRERSLNIKHFQSPVYKCNACDLCFDRQEVMSKHLISCSPIKKITRIHCICGLQFDEHNYEYHCKVHRKFPALLKKDITVVNSENIDVGGMKEKFVLKNNETVNAVQRKYKIKASAKDKPDKLVKEESIFGDKTSCVVYKCNCKLCFERLEFLLDHLNNCDPSEKITRILCMCGLEFDEHNYHYHREVHQKFTRLRVRKVTVSDDQRISISWAKEVFDEKFERNTVRSTKEAQVQTVHVNEPFATSSAAELLLKGNDTFEQLLGQKIVSIEIDKIKSSINGEESQTKITIIIAKEYEKTVECPSKTSTCDKNNELTDIGKSKMTVIQKDADNATNNITTPTLRDLATDNYTKYFSGFFRDTFVCKTSEEKIYDENISNNKTIGISDPADGETTKIAEQIAKQLNINVDRESSGKTTKETDNPDQKDSGTNAIIKQTNRPHKMNDSQENLDISSNETTTLTRTIQENKAIDYPGQNDIQANAIIEPTVGQHKINDSQENLDITVNETSTVTPIIPENIAIDNSGTKYSVTNVPVEATDRSNKFNNTQESSDISANETCI